MLNIIANVKSGKGRGLKNVKKVAGYCIKHNIPYALHLTNKRGHATEIASSLTQNGGTIVALGGDGTFHEVLNGIVDLQNTVLGFIPSGRGNDFVRSQGASLNPIEALEDILRGEITAVDFIEAGGKRCLNVGGTGLDVEVLRHVEGKTNKITYVVSLLDCLKHFSSYKVKVTVNGETKEHDCVIAGVCNGRAFGGNIPLAPNADITDGKIDLVVIDMPKDGKIFPLVPKFLKGKHLNFDITHHILCDEVLIEGDQAIQLDGEIYENLTLDCRIVKGGLKTFVVGNRKK